MRLKSVNGENTSLTRVFGSIFDINKNNEGGE